MKTKKLILSLAVVLTIISCTNDYEFMDDYYTQDWETSLIQVVSENATLYANSGIFLRDYKETDINVLDRLAFINSESRYPVMTGDKITLAPYEFISFDTLMCHVKSFHIDNLVKYVLEHKSELIAIRIRWVVNDALMNTVAIFDKKSGELVYDNLLYNTITIGEKKLNSLRKHKLTRAEWGYYNGQDQGGETIQGSDSFSYSDGNGCWIATINLNWTEHGYWALQISERENNMYCFEYNYTHIHTDFNWNESRNPGISSGYNLQKDAMELSPNDYNFRIKYYFFIGTSSYTVHLPSIYEAPIYTSYGEGDVRIYDEKPERSPDYVDKDLFPNIEP